MRLAAAVLSPVQPDTGLFHFRTTLKDRKVLYSAAAISVCFHSTCMHLFSCKQQFGMHPSYFVILLLDYWFFPKCFQSNACRFGAASGVFDKAGEGELHSVLNVFVRVEVKTCSVCVCVCVRVYICMPACRCVDMCRVCKTKSKKHPTPFSHHIFIEDIIDFT